jgi:hypothetical protein
LEAGMKLLHILALQNRQFQEPVFNRFLEFSFILQGMILNDYVSSQTNRQVCIKISYAIYEVLLHDLKVGV